MFEREKEGDRTQKVRRHDKFRKEWSQQMQVPNGTGPGVRRSKRHLLASRTLFTHYTLRTKFTHFIY